MYGSILFPVDGHSSTEQATSQVLNLARAFDAELHTLYVVESTPQLTEDEQQLLHDSLEKQGQRATLAVAEQASELGIETTRHIREGRPYESILSYVDEQDIDLVVMPTQARTDIEQAYLGSTTQRVLERAAVPVLAPKPAETVPDAPFEMINRVIIPTDGSDGAERAAEQALTVAEHFDADVRVVYVVDTNTYRMQDSDRSIVGLLKEGGNQAVETIATAAQERNLNVSTVVLRGDPFDEILQYVTGANGDLIAMGTRGQSAGQDRVLGSTTARILQRAEIPVLTVT